MKGTWSGYYQYSNPELQKAIGFERTFFKITINSFDGKHFSGIVHDDIESGGMEGEGEIIGEVDGEKIYLKKYMPWESLLYPDGKTINTHKKHPTIFYTGTISKTGTEINGVWKFKMRIFFLFGFLPMPYKPGKGIWSMTLQ